MTSTTDLIAERTWHKANRVLPPVMQEVAVRGCDTMGSWVIYKDVWWQPYKGQPDTKGRWMYKNENGIVNRLPESDDVDEWSDLCQK